MKPVDNEPQRSHRVCSLHFCYGKPKKEQHSASDVYLNSVFCGMLLKVELGLIF